MEGNAGASRRAGLVLGALLIVGGLALLAAQVYGYDIRVDLEQFGWPVFIVVPGLVLLLVGLALSDEPGVGLAIAGGIVSTIGLVLAYQDATNHYASWAYAWALVAPGAVGAAMVLWGTLHLRGAVVRTGLGSLGVGLVLFLVFFGFFEGVLNIGGQRGLAAYGRQALPFALILAGVLVVLSGLLPQRGPRPYRGTWPDAGAWQPGPERPPGAEWQPGEQPPSPPLRVPPAPAESAEVGSAAEPTAADGEQDQPG